MSSRFVLPEPLGPPISACGDASASVRLDRYPRRRTRRGRTARTATIPRPELSPAAGRRRCRPALRQALVLDRDVVADRRDLAARRRRGRGRPETCGPVIDVVATTPSRFGGLREADGLDRRGDRQRHVEQHQPRSRTPDRRAATRWSWRWSSSRQRPAVAQQHRDDPRLGAGAAAAGRARAQRRLAADQHPGVHPADPVGQLVEQPRRGWPGSCTVSSPLRVSG